MVEVHSLVGGWSRPVEEGGRLGASWNIKFLYCRGVLNCFVLLVDFIVVFVLQTVRFKNELVRNITIKLGYANAKVSLYLTPQHRISDSLYLGIKW